MSFHKAPPPRRDRSDEFASLVVERQKSRMAGRMDAPTVIVKPAPPKIEQRKVQSIRDSARGEECTVRIVGACNSRPDTVVWSHVPSLVGDRGMGLKALDLCGAYACAACHDVVDGRRGLPPGASAMSVRLDWFQGHMRSLVLLARKGLV